MTLMLVESCFEFHLFFSCRNDVLAFTSPLDPPHSSMMLPIYVKIFTSSKVSTSSVIGLASYLLYLRNLLFSLRMLKPTTVEAAAKLFVLTCICCFVWDRRAKLSSKSKSYNSLGAIHCVLCFPQHVAVFTIQ